MPPEVFTTEYKNPVATRRPAAPTQPAEAAQAARARPAGTRLRRRTVCCANAAGQTLKAEFLLGSPTFERHRAAAISDDLKKLGIDADVRIVDRRSINAGAGRMISTSRRPRFAQSMSPGNEQRVLLGIGGCRSGRRRQRHRHQEPRHRQADRCVVFAKDRDELVAATRALDRVLLWSNYVVPQWYYPFERLAYWDKFRSAIESYPPTIRHSSGSGGTTRRRQEARRGTRAVNTAIAAVASSGCATSGLASRGRAIGSRGACGLLAGAAEGRPTASRLSATSSTRRTSSTSTTSILTPRKAAGYRADRHRRDADVRQFQWLHPEGRCCPRPRPAVRHPDGAA